MANAPFPIQPELTAIAIRYRHPPMIADAVLPRLRVGKQEFKWLEHVLEESFTIPDTKVGRRSRPNEVEFNAIEQTSSTVDYALDDPIPQADLMNAPPNHDPMAVAVEYVMKLIELDREVRVGGMVFNANTYPTGRKVTLSGSTQWSHVDSNPVDAMLSAMDLMVMRPNVVVFGQAVWTKVRQHPKVVNAIFGANANAGTATREQVAALLEVDRIEVGQGWVNTARKGQPRNMVRVWGKHAAMLHLDSQADTQRGSTFGFTAQWGDRIAGAIPDPHIGARGGQRVRAGESVREIVAAPDFGYFFENAVA